MITGSSFPREGQETFNNGISSKERRECFVVSELATQPRLDVFLFQRAVLPSRSQIQRAILEGRVLVNEISVKAGYKLKNGDRIVLWHKEIESAGIKPEPVALNIVHEDHDLLVVDKPAGMVVHPSIGHSSGTLVNAIMAHCQDLSGIGGVERPGIVHRLDKDTSGLLVIAKNDRAHLSLVKQFQSREVEKVYLALVHGRIREERGVIDLPVGRDRIDRKKMSSRTLRGKAALTKWVVMEYFRFFTLLEVRIETGRTHQIRVHLSGLGHPVVGDPLYGGARRRGDMDAHTINLIKVMSRQALHAARLSFAHPVSREWLSFVSPLPPDFARLCQGLRSC